MSRPAPEWLSMRAARRPHEPALRTGRLSLTRWQLLEAADALACALAGEGLAAGDRVAGLLAEDAAAVVLINAVRRLGLVLVPLNRRLTTTELCHQLDRAGASSVVCDRAHAAAAGACASASRSVLGVEALLAGSPCGARPRLLDEIDLDAPAAVVFTSGTSGQPKGALLTHGNLAASAHAWASVLEPRPSDRWLVSLPLFHVAGLAIVARAARWGAELGLIGPFDAARVAGAIDGGVTHLSLVPAQLVQLLDMRRGRPVPSTLRAILLGGGPIPADLLARARDEGYPVLTTYGLTETGSGIAVGGADAATLADPTAARPLPGVELRVMSDGAADGSGEILVRGRMVFAGYVDDAPATAAVLREGWLHTGDYGTLDEAGLLRVVDRREDLIISGGENVHASEVEAVLLSHPGVVEAGVVGLPDARWGQVPGAAVVLGPGMDVSEEELQRYCRERLAGFKVPVSVQRLEELPRTELGKIRRHRLRESMPPEAT